MTVSRATGLGRLSAVIARTQLWVWSAVLISFLICGVISWLYAYQQQGLAQSEARLDTVRQARIDLSDGFLHLVLADGEERPFDREQGLALLRQALASLDRAAGGAAYMAPAFALERAVAELRAGLGEWLASGTHDPAAVARLRIALHSVIAEADRIDARILGELQALAKHQRSIFLGTIITAAALLALICAAISFIGRAKERSELERLQAEEALRETAQTLTAVIDSCPIGIVGLSSRREVIIWSREAERIFGYSRDEIAKDVYAVMPPEELEQGKQFMARVLAGEALHDVEVRRLRKGGQRLTLRYSCAPLYDRDGRPSGAINAIVDVTERRAMEAQLAQAQKMEAIGNLAGGIAHDFNNTLGVIVGNMDLLLTELRPGSEEAAMVESALQAAQRGADLTGALLAFARRQPLSPRITDVNVLIGGMSPMLHRALGEQISIRIVTAEDLWPVQVDPGQLQAALLNLALNARDAMPEGGKLTIETINARLDSEDVAVAFEGGPGDYVLLIVADTGIGMSADILAHIFEPFFTTKDPGKGTGLGLSMVFGFVKQSGGHIKAYSEPGFGSTMKLYLPRAPIGESAAEEVSLDAPALAQSGEAILAVEDHPDMRRTVAGQLRSLGYAVVEADSPRAALDVLASDARIDLLFTDIVMPGGMSGIELTRAARERRPGLKVVATSGFHMGALENGKRLPADVPLLTKPYRLVDLARILRATLDIPPEAAPGGP